MSFRGRSFFLCGVLSAFVLGACSSGSGQVPSDGSDSGGSELDAVADHSDAPDAATEASSDSAIDTSDVCATSVTVTLGSKTVTFDRAQYGTNLATDAGAITWHVELHHGGDPACPTPSSKTPEQTLVLANPIQGKSMSQADGLKLSLLDFKGVLTTDPILKATAVSLVPKPECGKSAWTISATFPGGNATGIFTAEHCTSMDETP